MAQQEYILQLQNVVKRFGGITASNDITINVPRGSIYGIIGPNGAGKTTLFNMITGVYDTTEGKVLFEGQQVNGLPTHVIAARGNRPDLSKYPPVRGTCRSTTIC